MTKERKKAATPTLLHACPCGQVPTNLMIEVAERGKYGRTMADCCGMWEVEFRNGFATDAATTNRRAIEAWNRAPRPAA